MRHRLVLFAVIFAALPSPAVAQQDSTRTVPSVIGMDVESAKRLLAQRADLRATVRQASASGVREGTVIDQNPRGGSPIPKNRIVDLHVATTNRDPSHQPRVRPVDVIGAAAGAAAIGILLSRVTRRPARPDTAHPPASAPPATGEPSTPIPTNPVTPDPKPNAAPTAPTGSEQPPGRASEAAPAAPNTPDEPKPIAAAPTPIKPASSATVVMPSVVRQPIAVAALTVTRAGLLADANEIARDSAGGFVLGQTPEAGVTVPVGTVVRLFRGVRVPLVEAMSIDSAKMIVRAAELTTSGEASTVVGSSAVLAQRPAAGEIVSPGTVVELETIPPPRTGATINPFLILLLSLLLLTAAGTMLRRRQKGRPAYRPPVIRPEAHRDSGSHEIQSKRDVIGRSEIRLAARAGSVSSDVRSDRSIIKEDSDG